MSVDSYDCEPWKFFSRLDRRARKDHECSACCETIRRGDVYSEATYLADQTPDRSRHCLRCVALSSRIGEEHRRRRTGCAPAVDLDCGHTWREEFREEPPPDVARLAFATPAEMQAEYLAKVAARK